MMHRRGFNAGRVDAKQTSRNRNRFQRLDPDIAGRYEDLDDDVSVPARSVQSRLQRPGTAGASSSQPTRNPFDKRVANTGVKNAELVYKVRIPGGAKKFDATWIVKQLNQKIEHFKAWLFKENARGDWEFFVRDEDTSQAIRANSRRIYHRETSSKVEFQITRVPAPWMQMKRQDIEIVQKVVDSRYNAESRMLDLSDFGNDKEFTSRDMLMTLTKSNVMIVVLDRIDERYGNITALSLANNRLHHLDYVSALVTVAKFVKVLEMSHNMVQSTEELKLLAGLPVENFYFEGNPVIEVLSSASAYLSMVQDVFPKCSVLDGTPVTPRVVGPTSSEDIAPYRAGFYSNQQIRELVEQFVVAFYQIYDGQDGQTTRKQLVEAYDENNSKFTLAITNMNTNGEKQYYPVRECYDTYIRQSHNILQEEYFARNRATRTARGAMDIAVSLSKLPITNHLTQTFVVDVFLVSNELLGFTVQGLFEDGKLAKEGDVPQPNFFSRSFTVAPRDGGKVAVISDQLFITAASTERLQKYRALLDQAEKNGAAQEIVNPVAQASIAINGLGFSGEPPKEMKEQMITAFCQYSGMIIPWSEKCLADFGWNYDLACQKFQEIRATVPAEAFAQ
ncbi:unnamed protein product [Caenorhabditis angaria]|uniref:Uncharacterized protein n=1 Tax=Caenorhabditis angaria TaxID=860376 RepID=A0A9P1N700_9PELO|nr:unnamed protein product [Caenorhabditis angaria]